MKIAKNFLVMVLWMAVRVALSEIADDVGNEFDGRHQEVEAAGANHFTDTLPGDPQVDYPTYTEIPRTAFSCRGKVNWQYYADIDTNCQVFHICETGYSKISFLCPIGTIFNQRHLVCDWWYNVDCVDSVDLYTLTNDYNDPELSLQAQQEEEDRRGFDLSLASSGGNSDPANPSDTQEKTKKNGKKRDRLKNSM